MTSPARIRRALDALEARRVAIEREIVQDIEKKFFSGPEDRMLHTLAADLVARNGYTFDDPASQSHNQSSATIVWS